MRNEETADLAKALNSKYTQWEEGDLTQGEIVDFFDMLLKTRAFPLLNGSRRRVAFKTAMKLRSNGVL